VSAPRIGSLFTGYGGLDAAALALLGPESHVVWHSDIKPAACILLDRRDLGVPNLGDIHAINPGSVEPVDALTFGWPCQPHSSAGKRLGEADPRALWPEVARLVAGLRPRYLFGENVARVASNGELRRVVAALAELGYLGTYRTLRASDVGAPHRRDRLFLFAVRGDVADAGGGPVAGAAALAGGGAGPAGLGAAEPGGRDLGAPDLTLLPTPCETDRKGSNPLNRPVKDDDLPTRIARLLPTPSASSYGTNQGGAAGRVGPVRESLSTMAGNGHLHRWGRYAAAVARWEALTRPAPEPTQVSPRTGKPQLAPAFVEWMMGLPAGWVTDVPGLSRNQQLSLLGDGVCPQQACAAFDELAGRMFHVEHAA
jgi:DNA (cytosine-5)-methyltransferase 1